MKYILFALLFSPLVGFSQDCPVKKVTGQFSQEPRITTGFFTLNGGKLSIDADSKEVDFFFTINNGAEGICFDNSSSAQVIFEGGRQKANYKNSGSMNCKGLFHFNFRNSTSTPSALNNLATRKVATIRFTGNDKSVTEITLSPEQQETLMSLAGCVIKEAKSLIK